MSQSKLFSPLKVGHNELKHRIVLAPMTRYRANEEHIPLDFVKDYYSQRASVPGTLLVTEATFISPRASGMKNVPGIWKPEQIAAWKSVTNAVHDRKCFIFLQLWALGNKASLDVLQRAEGGPYPVVGASALPLKSTTGGDHVSHALSPSEIQEFINDYATAAKNAIAAGFDGVELHGANGYLIDQFLQDVCNKRTDEYGGSIENRSRFGLEVAKAVISAIGDSQKVGLRLSPWTSFDGETMKDPVPQFLHFISELKKLNMAYLHLVESRRSGDVASGQYDALTTRNDPYIKEWGTENAIILAGGYTPETAMKMVDENQKSSDVCIAFGRFYTSNPDLPFRVKAGIPFSPYDRSTFYKPMSPDGYIDHAPSPEYQAQMAA